MVRREGIGPSTLSLKGSCSTTELPAHTGQSVPIFLSLDKILAFRSMLSIIRSI